jgi:threonine dehydratase
MTAPASIAHADIVGARPAVTVAVARTPTLRAQFVEERLGGPVALKTENLQLGGSFKIRRAVAKLGTLPIGPKLGHRLPGAVRRTSCSVGS